MYDNEKKLEETIITTQKTKLIHILINLKLLSKKQFYTIII